MASERPGTAPISFDAADPTASVMPRRSASSPTESFNSRVRTAVDRHGHFPHELAARKVVYLVVKGHGGWSKRTDPARKINNWKAVLNQLVLHFGDRLDLQPPTPGAPRPTHDTQQAALPRETACSACHTPPAPAFFAIRTPCPQTLPTHSIDNTPTLIRPRARLATHSRRRTLHLPKDWPWAAPIITCWKRLCALDPW